MLRRTLIPGMVGAVAIGSMLTYAAVADNRSSSKQSAQTSKAGITLISGDAEDVVGDRERFVTAYRRLTETQYRNTIADIFGEDIKVEGRFEPELRESGLQAVGNAELSITTSGMEQYYGMARAIASQLVNAEDATDRFGCDMQASKTAARACAEAYFEQTGERLFRRPVRKNEMALNMAIWDQAAEQDSVKKAFENTLVSLLISPEFLFRSEIAERVGDGEYRLDAFSKAERLAFYLWDAAPDAELLKAAESGKLHNQAELEAQVQRMMNDPQFEAGVRAFFVDFLHFESFDTLTKDSQTYPKFSQAVADSAREETLRFMLRLLVEEEGDYRDIFTSRKTVINRPLAAVYNVPYASKADWANFEFPEDTARSGVLTQVTFSSLFSHPGSSSPTLRGKYLAEIFQCTKIPDPPADVDFSKVQALAEGTVRERLDAHRTDPTCASCHVLMDPAGLALERFDGIGQFREMENGEPIDVSADIFGSHYEGARGIGEYLHDNPQTSACFVQKAYNYGTGRPFDYRDASVLSAYEEEFAAEGYKLKPLLENVLTDPKFFEVVVPEGLQARSTSAALETDTAARGGQK